MRGNSRAGAAHKVALGGILSGISLLILLAGGYTSVGTFAAPIFAGICLVPIAIDISAKWALLCYLAISLLSLLLVPDMELVLFFVALMGWYPIFWPALQRLRGRAARLIVKLLLFNAAVAAVYAVLLFLFVSAELWQELAARRWWFLAGGLAVGNLTFFLYDNLLDKVRQIYCHRIRKYIFR